MRGGDLCADARGAVRHDWIKEADDVNTFLQHSRGEFLRLRGVADHDRNDWMHAGFDDQAALGQSGAEKFCVLFKFVAEFRRCAEKLERFQGSSNNWWGDCVGEQIRPRTLPQQIDNLLSPACEAAAGAAERFSKCAGDDVDPAHHAAILVCATPSFPEKSGGVRVIDYGERVMFFREVAKGR